MVLELKPLLDSYQKDYGVLSTRGIFIFEIGDFVIIQIKRLELNNDSNAF